MKVVRPDGTWEHRFLRHLREHVLEHYWFLFDWTFHRDESDFLLAVEGDRIEGALLVFGEQIAQVRGSRQAVAALLPHLDRPRVEMSVPRDCKDLVLARYAPQMQSEILLMHLDKGNEAIRKTTEPVPLVESDAPAVRDLLRQANPGGWWDELRVEQVVERLRTTYWLGVRVDGEVVAVGNTRFVEFGSNIGVVATAEGHRNKGYATSIVSSLVQAIFARHEKALIHVLRDNAPGVRAYEKVGFRPFNAYFLVRNAVRR